MSKMIDCRVLKTTIANSQKDTENEDGTVNKRGVIHEGKIVTLPRKEAKYLKAIGKVEYDEDDDRPDDLNSMTFFGKSKEADDDLDD